MRGEVLLDQPLRGTREPRIDDWVLPCADASVVSGKANAIRRTSAQVAMLDIVAHRHIVLVAFRMCVSRAGRSQWSTSDGAR